MPDLLHDGLSTRRRQSACEYPDAVKVFGSVMRKDEVGKAFEVDVSSNHFVRRRLEREHLLDLERARRSLFLALYRFFDDLHR